MAAGGMDGSMQQRDADISVGTVLGDLLHDSLDEATESAEKATAAPLVHEGGRWRCCSSQLPPVVPQTPSVELELELEASPPKGGGDGWRRCCPPPKAPLMEENPVEDSVTIQAPPPPPPPPQLDLPGLSERYGALTQMILQDRRIESAGGLQQLGSGPGLRELSPRAQSSSGSEHSPRAGELPPANENEVGTRNSHYYWSTWGRSERLRGSSGECAFSGGEWCGCERDGGWGGDTAAQADLLRGLRVHVGVTRGACFNFAVVPPRPTPAHSPPPHLRRSTPL